MSGSPDLVGHWNLVLLVLFFRNPIYIDIHNQMIMAVKRSLKLVEITYIVLQQKKTPIFCRLSDWYLPLEFTLQYIHGRKMLCQVTVFHSFLNLAYGNLTY